LTNEEIENYYHNGHEGIEIAYAVDSEELNYRNQYPLILQRNVELEAQRIKDEIAAAEAKRLAEEQKRIEDEAALQRQIEEDERKRIEAERLANETITIYLPAYELHNRYFKKNTAKGP
jgi:serine phosphatase RsbU (regulator of sigma subunit)